MLDDIQTNSQSALEELRDLARGIYPPLLADKGLAAALEAQSRKSPMPVSIDSNGTRRYPQDVESAVYFCVLEALNNVAKYAEASAATVRLSEREGSLRFEVADDGKGFDSRTAHGTGLRGMADRLDAVGGRLQVREPVPHHPEVRLVVPTADTQGMAEPELASQRAGRVAGEGDTGRVPPRILPGAFVIIGEALANVAKHASGTNVAVRLFAKKDHHPGVEILRRRAAEVGGRLRVESGYGQGTRDIAALLIHGVAS
jgi:signal transduction histidine kinase